MEKNIDFIKTDHGYVSEFVAQSDFALHLEGKTSINVVVYAKSIEDGEYDVINNISKTGNVYDRDQPKMSYPKWIKIVSKDRLEKAIIVKASTSATVSFWVDDEGNLIVNS